MKELIKINTIPLATESDYISYKGAVTLFLVSNSILVTDPLFKKAQQELERIRENIQLYNSEISEEEKNKLLLKIYFKRSKLNKKLIKFLIKDQCYSSSSLTSGSSLF